MDESQLSGFSQVVSLGRRGKRLIYRAVNEHDEEVVLMLFDSENNDNSENRKFQWLGEQLASKPIRHFVSIVRWEISEGQRVVAFKAPQGTELRRITSGANGISAEFGFLLTKALVTCCSDHHEIGLNFGVLSVDQIVITRQGPIFVPDFEFYINQVSESPDYDSELDVYWSSPGLRHRNDNEDIANLGHVIAFLVSQIHDKESLNLLFSNESSGLDSFLEKIISDMLNENPLLRPSALSLVNEIENFVSERHQLLNTSIDPGYGVVNFDDETDFRMFSKSQVNSAPSSHKDRTNKRNVFTFIGVTVAFCIVAVMLATSMKSRDAEVNEDTSTTEVTTSVTTPSSTVVVKNPQTTVAMSALASARENWRLTTQNFLWSIGPEPIAVGNAVYAIASNQDLFPETAPQEKLTNLVLAQWNGQGWVSIQTTNLKNDAPELLNVMSSPSGEQIFLYTRCCVGHPTEALQTVPVNRIFAIRKGQIFDLLNDENMSATDVPAFDVAFLENSLSGTICIDPKINSSDFGNAGQCRTTRQITVRFNIDGSEQIDYDDQEYEVSATTSSIPLSTVVEEISCDGSWITIVASTTAAGAQIGVDQNPGSRFLAGTTCPSLTQTISNGPSKGEVLYLIIYGPYFDHEAGSAKCRELGKKTKSECYVKSLSNNPADGNVGYGPND